MRVTLVCSIVFACVGGTVAQRPLDTAELLRRMANPQWLFRPPSPGERCVQFSSYDRRSDRGPGDPAAWYANHDRGNYLRTVERDGTQEHVLVDVDGPGALARLWSANPAGTLHFDVDGARVWSVDFGRLARGEVPGIPHPLAAMRSRGGNLYLPIPFARHLTISATAGDLYYLADVALWPDGTEVQGFAGEQQLQRQRDAVQAYVAGEFGETAPETRVELPARVPPGHIVHSLRLEAKAETGADVRSVLRRTRLLVQCAGEVLIDVPVTDFFAGGPDWRPWRGAFLGVLPGDSGWGSGWLGFPMPFPRAGTIDLVTDGARQGVTFALHLARSPAELDEDTLLFRAGYHLAKANPTRPFGDHLVLHAEGTGRFVGCSLLVQNPSRIWWGEGDEKVWVDGEPFPSWFGTGTEDYFGYAWCDPTPFTAPFHAQVQCEGPMNFGRTQLHRTHVLDSIPFQHSLRFEFERWHWIEDTEIDYATVAYWYGAAGARSDLPPVPPAAERRLAHLERPRIFVAENAFEGESLPVLRCTGGVHEVQSLAFFEGRFSRDAHRWWRDGRIGDVLELQVPVAEAGRYRVTVAMTKADDFGIVKISLAGKPLGEPFDGYAEQVTPTGPLVAGEVDLEAGTAVLRFELVGRNELAKPRHMVGLDYVRLEKVR
ncbi:MAG TPA: DUF2961 domain-containing protein [bacterium]|nr:DUF2961 domain-containing protein [bacterium]